MNRWSCSCRKPFLISPWLPTLLSHGSSGEVLVLHSPKKPEGQGMTRDTPISYGILQPCSSKHSECGLCVETWAWWAPWGPTGWPPTVCFSIWFRLHPWWCCLVMHNIFNDAFHCCFPVQSAKFRGVLPTNSVFITVLFFYAILWSRKVQWQLNGVRK